MRQSHWKDVWYAQIIPGVGLLAAYLLVRILWTIDNLPRALRWE